MSPTVEVEVRRNRHGSVLAYADRDRAARLLADHRAVLQSLYDLDDRRHGRTARPLLSSPSATTLPPSMNWISETGSGVTSRPTTRSRSSRPPVPRRRRRTRG